MSLYSSIAGEKYGKFVGKDKYTTKESEKLIRLFMHYKEEIDYIIEKAEEFYRVN